MTFFLTFGFGTGFNVFASSILGNPIKSPLSFNFKLSGFGGKSVRTSLLSSNLSKPLDIELPFTFFSLFVI